MTFGLLAVVAAVAPNVLLSACTRQPSAGSTPPPSIQRVMSPEACSALTASMPAGYNWNGGWSEGVCTIEGR